MSAPLQKHGQVLLDHLPILMVPVKALVPYLLGTKFFYTAGVTGFGCMIAAGVPAAGAGPGPGTTGATGAARAALKAL